MHWLSVMLMMIMLMLVTFLWLVQSKRKVLALSLIPKNLLSSNQNNSEISKWISNISVCHSVAPIGTLKCEFKPRKPIFFENAFWDWDSLCFNCSKQHNLDFHFQYFIVSKSNLVNIGGHLRNWETFWETNIILISLSVPNVTVAFSMRKQLE